MSYINKKKVLFYSRINKSLSANYGVANKCDEQVEGLRRMGWEVDYIWLNDDGVFLNQNIIFSFVAKLRRITFFNYFFLYFRFHAILRNKVDFLNYQLVYMRYELSHPQFLTTLRKIRRENPNIKIILEIPTYPYGLEQNGMLRNFQYYIDRRYRRHLKGLVDRVVHYGIEKKIFGIPAFRMSNGIDARSINLIVSHQKPNSINLLAVGAWNYWHGLDRLILGLGNYYSGNNQKEKVHLTIVGNGAILKLYKKLVSQNMLEQHVKFVPPLPRKILDNYFYQADIGIGTLAIFRKGLCLDSSLKHREYCARGLPFILSTDDLDFPKTIPWVHYFPENEQAISISSLLEFNKKLKKVERLENKIREYAEENLSWEKRWRQLLSALSNFNTSE